MSSMLERFMSQLGDEDIVCGIVLIIDNTT